MTIDQLISAGAFGTLGLALGKAFDIWLARVNAKDSNSVTLVNHTSEQTKVLIDQLGTVIKDQTLQIKEITTERNGLQRDIFRITPMAQKMTDFEEDLHDYGMTLEDCLIMIRESTNLPDGVLGRRWLDHMRRLRPNTPSGEDGKKTNE